MSDSVNIVLPPVENDALSTALRLLTKEIATKGLAEPKHGCFGGEWGYGCQYENDTFLMHPYCWCEKDECPWCGGCSGPEVEHRSACYSSRLDKIREKHKTPGVVGYRYVPLDCKPYEAERTALCADFGLSPTDGCEVHCTCDWRDRWLRCSCDWHQGRGVFRFGKAMEAPNFWHKPTGLRLRWYKYIGRGMEIDAAPAEWKPLDVLRSCLESIGTEQPQ